VTAPSQTDRPALEVQCGSMDHSVHAVPGAHQRSATLAACVSVAVMWCRLLHSLLAVGLLCTAVHASAGIKISSVDREVGVIPAVNAIGVTLSLQYTLLLSYPDGAQHIDRSQFLISW